ARAQHARLFEVGAAAALALGDPAALAEVLESGRAMALLESLEGREALRAIALREDHRRAETKARAAVAEARALYHRALRRRKRTVLRAAEAQLEVVVGRIRRDARARAGLVFPQADDLPTLAGHLTQGEVLVLYGQTRTHYLALVVTEAGGRIVPLATREVIDAACEAAVAVTHASDVPHVKALAALETLLLKPLALGAKVQRVFVSPVGEIFRASLVSLDPKRIVAHVPSGTTLGLLRERRAARGKGVVAFGGVDYRTHARLSDLPASKEEAGEVGERSILGKDATEAGVRSVMASATRLRALHFACHGLFDQERPMWSALALTRAAPDDGMLTVSEIFGLQVQADLVTLSACESGRGRVYQAEGLLGLPRAFAYAGAPRVLCSLWKVDDDATRALMGKFYALWNPKTGAGMPAAQALREAQAYVRAQPQWKAPYYWAAWVVWGLP
ncbi:MAG: CHAT domain-containing protein, partial [Planctomycetota bacterium]|nr:CHAT domain-containing protein [Planctomycetota bacterium]